MYIAIFFEFGRSEVTSAARPTRDLAVYSLYFLLLPLQLAVSPRARAKQSNIFASAERREPENFDISELTHTGFLR